MLLCLNFLCTILFLLKIHFSPLKLKKMRELFSYEKLPQKQKRFFYILFLRVNPCMRFIKIQRSLIKSPPTNGTLQMTMAK